MHKKKGHRIKLSYRSLEDRKAENVSFFSPATLDINAISTLCTTCMNVELTEIWEGKEGYVYPSNSSNYKYLTVSFIGSFTANGINYTTERTYLKHVKKSYASKESLLPFFKNIYGNSFIFRAFEVSYK